ncbi:ATP-binding protein [Nocardioides seonyuensis]|uniref:ATP-binding protein n=1 Tax=Nocardioides seonyuensis TaxID=2518371 RepID=A0A4P7ID44_9ACTN|nr:ATP-binding protein [Nocardioides seonyuensis]QBX55065.1 ATP-binding protein [Nocardioides seonyuensis]
MIVVDGRIDREKVLELLAAGGEQEALDFKATLDLADTGARLDFVKDALSMGNLPEGGYIVLGVKDDGTLAVNDDPLDLTGRPYDPSKLRDHVKNWCEAPVNITSAQHDVEGRNVVLIYVFPNPDGLPVPASKTAEAPTADGKMRTVFRQGEVLLREGPTNVRLRYSHWNTLLARYRQQARDEARHDADALVNRVVQSLDAAQPGGKTEIPLDEAMSGEALITAVGALFEAGATVQMRRFLNTVRATASTPRNNADRDRALDALGLIACQAVLYDQKDTYNAAIEALWRVYNAGGSSPQHVLSTGADRDTGEHLLAVILRVYAVGALVVREKRWGYLTSLVLRSVDVSPTYGYASWLRHGLVYAARVDLLQGDEGRHRGGQALSLARALIAGRAPLRPDYAVDVALPPAEDLASDDWILNSLCQFDVWWCVLARASTEADGFHGGIFYPSCAAFHQYRSQPAIDAIALNEEARQLAFPGVPDLTTATALAVVVEVSVRESQNYGGFWVGIDENPRVTAWVAEHINYK